MQISWQEQALTDLDEALAYIAVDDPAAAYRLGAAIITKADQQLTAHPHSGRPGRVAGTRELVVHENYLLAYRVQDEVVQVLAVMHAARLWPGSF